MKKFKLIKIIRNSLRYKVIAGIIVGAVAVTGISIAVYNHNSKPIKSSAASASKNKNDDKNVADSKDDGKNTPSINPTNSPDTPNATSTPSVSTMNGNSTADNSTQSSNSTTTGSTKSVNNTASKETAGASSDSTSSDSSQQTTQSSAPAAAPAPTQAPKPASAPAAAPARASGVDQALTDKLNSEGETVSNFKMAYPNCTKINDLETAAREIAFGQPLTVDITTPWVEKPSRDKLHYMGNTVNVVTGETTYYYTRFKQMPDANDCFNYVIAYYDSSIQNYKLYYVKIRLA